MAMRQDASTGQLTDDGAAEKPKDPKHPTMHIKVHSAFKVYFDEEASSVSAVNDTGPFDILPHHHNFITLLSPCELVIRQNRDKDLLKIRIDRGIMHVKADSVIVFLDV
jgi:F0F1-type ATP synthase epsilon subunit